MRLLSCTAFFFSLMTVVAACNTVSPDDCWPNTSGGFGGSGTIPIGAGVGVTSGDFISPPSSHPLDAPGAANPCVITPTGCDAQCLAKYEAAAAECGMIASDADRKTCQDSAYAIYSSCEANCQQSSSCRKDCEDKAEACEAACAKLPKDDKAGRQRCWVACTNDFAKCVKKCKD